MTGDKEDNEFGSAFLTQWIAEAHIHTAGILASPTKVELDHQGICVTVWRNDRRHYSMVHIHAHYVWLVAVRKYISQDLATLRDVCVLLCLLWLFFCGFANTVYSLG